MDDIIASELQQITGIGPTRAAVLAAAGYDSLSALAAAAPEDIADLLRVGRAAAGEIILEAEQLREDGDESPFFPVDHRPQEASSHGTAVYEHFLTGKTRRN